MGKQKPVVVTGCGRSGTHWLANVLTHVFGPQEVAFEPVEYQNYSGVVVDSRLRWHMDHIQLGSRRIVHLVRDGRDVVRSLHKWYRNNHHWERSRFLGTGRMSSGAGDTVSFEECCGEWAHAIEIMGTRRVMRLEDLTTPQNAQTKHTLPHYSEWDDELTEIFWDICGEHMKRMGYER